MEKSRWPIWVVIIVLVGIAVYEIAGTYFVIDWIENVLPSLKDLMASF